MDSQPYRRRRPALSCVECRRRKIKCDRDDPCAHCVTARIECTYKGHGPESVARQSFQSGGPSASRSSPQGARAPHPPEDQQGSTTRSADGSTKHPSGSGLLSAVSDHHHEISGGPDFRGGSGSSSSITSSGRSRPDVRELSRRVEQLKKPSRGVQNHGASGIEQGMLALQPELQDAQMVLNKERVLKWNHWEGSSQEFDTLITCFVNYSTDEVSEDGEIAAVVDSIRDLMAECKVLARMTKTGRPSRRLLYPEVRLAPPPRQTADEMVDLYFCSFESAHRILHVPTFQAEYQRYWANPESAPINLSLKVLLVVGIGWSLRVSEDTTTESSSSSSMFHEYIYAAQAWLSGPLEKDRLDINGLQIYCLIILARQLSSIGGDLVWMSMGSLIHQAMQTGLHRDPKYLPRVSVLRAEVRRRLWATILEMAVQTSLDSGMPARISFDEFDTEPPANVDDDELDDSVSILQSRPRDVYTTTSMQLLLLDSLPVRLRVVQLLNGLHSRLQYLDVLALSSEVTAACRNCDDFNRQHARSGMTPFHRNLLDYMLRRFLLPLHFPFASQIRTNPLFSHSLRLTLDAALAIMSPEPDETYAILQVRSGGLFKGGFRSLITAIGLGLLAQVESERADGTLHGHSPYKELLKQATRDLVALSLKRIESGETNVKSHMFLTMILAQVEATEAGVPYELKIAQRTRESLEVCHDLLRVQFDQARLPEADRTELLTTLDVEGGDYGLELDLDFLMPDAGFLGPEISRNDMF